MAAKNHPSSPDTAPDTATGETPAKPVPNVFDDLIQRYAFAHVTGQAGIPRKFDGSTITNQRLAHVICEMRPGVKVGEVFVCKRTDATKPGAMEIVLQMPSASSNRFAKVFIVDSESSVNDFKAWSDRVINDFKTWRKIEKAQGRVARASAMSALAGTTGHGVASDSAEAEELGL